MLFKKILINLCFSNLYFVIKWSLLLCLVMGMGHSVLMLFEHNIVNISHNYAKFKISS